MNVIRITDGHPGRDVRPGAAVTRQALRKRGFLAVIRKCLSFGAENQIPYNWKGMDSFFLFFPSPVSATAMPEALISFDFACTILEPNYVTAYLTDGRVWISILNEQEVSKEEDDLPEIPKGTLTTAIVDVSNKGNSDVFAIFLAERLVLKYGGNINWNGIAHWEQLYEGLQRWRKEHPEGRPIIPQL